MRGSFFIPFFLFPLFFPLYSDSPLYRQPLESLPSLARYSLSRLCRLFLFVLPLSFCPRIGPSTDNRRIRGAGGAPVFGQPSEITRWGKKSVQRRPQGRRCLRAVSTRITASRPLTPRVSDLESISRRVNPLTLWGESQRQTAPSSRQRSINHERAVYGIKLTCVFMHTHARTHTHALNARTRICIYVRLKRASPGKHCSMRNEQRQVNVCQCEKKIDWYTLGWNRAEGKRRISTRHYGEALFFLKQAYKWGRDLHETLLSRARIRSIASPDWIARDHGVKIRSVLSGNCHSSKVVNWRCPRL